MPDVLVSVVIPAHDAERYLAEAIESVLAQDHRPLEVIVVDDGSRDRTQAVAEGYGEPVRCVRQEQAGASAARNRGAQAARGEYLAFLDADDRWERTKLSLQLNAAAAEPYPDIVFGHVRQFVSPDLPDHERDRIRCPDGLQPGPLPGTMLIRSTDFQRVGPYDCTLSVGEALDWLARARACGLRELMLPGHLMSRRLHTDNQMRRHGDARSYPAILKAALDRSRTGT
jgi:glycosyltransferase involved in cell wall biosynthesis